MKHRRRRAPLVIISPSLLELCQRHSPVAQAARVRGNAAGRHGGARPKYGTRERQAARREERAAALHPAVPGRTAADM